MRTTLFLLVVVTAFVGLACADGSSPEKASVPTAMQPAAPSLRWTPQGCPWSEAGEPRRQITICRGTVENISGHDLENISLRVKFPDALSDRYPIALLAAGASAAYEITLPGAESPKGGYVVTAEDDQGEPIGVKSD